MEIPCEQGTRALLGLCRAQGAGWWVPGVSSGSRLCIWPCVRRNTQSTPSTRSCSSCCGAARSSTACSARSSTASSEPAPPPHPTAGVSPPPVPPITVCLTFPRALLRARGGGAPLPRGRSRLFWLPLGLRPDRSRECAFGAH